MSTQSGFRPLKRGRTTESELDGISDDARGNLKGFKWFVVLALVVTAAGLFAHYVLKLF